MANKRARHLRKQLTDAERQDADARRTEWLESQNFRVVRFWNNEVFENIEGVIETIASALEEK